MRLQTRCLAGIVPVFLVLALAVGALVNHLVERETLWGMKEEAAGLATVVAEFTDTKDLADLLHGTMDEPRRASLLRPLGRILKNGRAERILAVMPTDGRVLFDVGPRASSNAAFRVPPDILTGLQGGKTRVSGVVMADPISGDRMLAYAPVTDERGGVMAVLVVQTDARPLAAQLHTTRMMTVRGGAVTVLVGILCALLASMILRRSLGRLNEAAAAAAGGQYARPLQENHGAIQEIRDLWNTFETMISVLRGVISKTRRELMDVEMFRSEKDLVSVFNAAYLQGGEKTGGALEFSAQPMNGGVAGGFMDLFESGNRIVCVFGQVAERDGGELRASLLGSAAVRYVKEQVQEADVITALQTATSVFPFSELRGVCWEKGRPVVVSGRYDPQTRRVVRAEHDVATGPALCFHDLGEVAERRIDLYLRTFPDQSISALMDQLILVVQAIQPRPSGVLCLVGRKQWPSGLT